MLVRVELSEASAHRKWDLPVLWLSPLPSWAYCQDLHTGALSSAPLTTLQQKGKGKKVFFLLLRYTHIYVKLAFLIVPHIRLLTAGSQVGTHHSTWLNNIQDQKAISEILKILFRKLKFHLPIFVECNRSSASNRNLCSKWIFSCIKMKSLYGFNKLK